MAEGDQAAQGDLLKTDGDKGAADAAAKTGADKAAADKATTDAAAADAAKADAAKADGAKTGDDKAKADADAKAKADADAKAKADAPKVDYAKAISEVPLPDGFKLDEAAAKTGADVFAKHNLTPEAVKDLVNLYAQQTKAGADGNANAFAKQVEGWKTASTSDKDLGAENMGAAKAALTKYFDVPTMEVLELFGLTNHPGFLKGGLKIGKAIKDDSVVTGNAAPNGRDARALFPNSDMNP